MFEHCNCITVLGRHLGFTFFHPSSPYRIVDDCGGAFAMGAIGGGIFSFVKGWRNSPAVRATIV